MTNEEYNNLWSTDILEGFIDKFCTYEEQDDLSDGDDIVSIPIVKYGTEGRDVYYYFYDAIKSKLLKDSGAVGEVTINQTTSEVPERETPKSNGTVEKASDSTRPGN